MEIKKIELVWIELLYFEMASDEDESGDAFNDKEEIEVYHKYLCQEIWKTVTYVNCFASITQAVGGKKCMVWQKT